MKKMELETLKSNLAEIVPKNGLKEKLEYSYKNKKPLRIKLGFDPTAPDLHLGHAVILKKLKQFQDYGHKLVIIIGDFTAIIGDPTGRNKTRPPLSNEQIKINANTYLDQLSKIIDISKAEIHFNATWLDKIKLSELIKLLSKVTLSQMIEREDFSNRYKNNLPIFFHELLYPILQGMDSLQIDSDIEMGGTDQLFNCLVGRDLQKSFDKPSQIVCSMPLLRGIDGTKKMSKSYGNYIGITEDPNNIFGKVMSIPDNLISEYLKLASSFNEKEINEMEEELSKHSVNPMEIKKKLAFNIVEQYYDATIAEKSVDFFYNQVQSRNDELIKYENIDVSKLKLENNKISLLDLCKYIKKDMSKSNLRKMIENGGVKINLEKETDPFKELDLTCTLRLKIGKRGFFQIT